MIYIGPGFLAVVWFGSSPTSSLVNKLHRRHRKTICLREKGKGWARSRIIRPQESLVLYKPLKTLWYVSVVLCVFLEARRALLLWYVIKKLFFMALQAVTRKDFHGTEAGRVSIFFISALGTNSSQDKHISQRIYWTTRRTNAFLSSVASILDSYLTLFYTRGFRDNGSSWKGVHFVI